MSQQQPFIYHYKPLHPDGMPVEFIPITNLFKSSIKPKSKNNPKPNPKPNPENDWVRIARNRRELKKK